MIKRIIYTAICIALCVVLPMAFHTVPNAGNIFTPMHIPVLICGLICGPVFGTICGIMGPVLSAVFTGMPPMAIVPGMMIELLCYGLVCGVLIRFVHTKHIYLDLYISLIAAMIIGRIAGGIAKAFIFSASDYSIAAWASGYFLVGIPGIVISLIAVPTIVLALIKAKLISNKYE